MALIKILKLLCSMIFKILIIAFIVSLGFIKIIKKIIIQIIKLEI